MEEEKTETLPAQEAPQAEQQSTPVSQPLPEAPEINNKPQKLLIYLLSALTFMVIGAFGFWVYQRMANQKAVTMPKPPTSSIRPTGAQKQSLSSNDFIVTEVIVNHTNYAPPNENQESLKFGYESVLGKYEADVGILISSNFDCPREALELEEYEGSILGSHGIEEAITYFLPDIDVSACEKVAETKEYKLFTKWNRRSDTDWIILVLGYFGTDDTYSEFKAYKYEINRNSLLNDKSKAEELKNYEQNYIETSNFSLTNNPKILSVSDFSATSNGNNFNLAMNLEFSNKCFADNSVGLESKMWASGNDDTTYIWANLKPKPSQKGCPEMYSPQKEKVEFSFSNQFDLSNAVVLVPNYPSGKALPVYLKKIKI